ncbi:MAG: hypothetical protein V7L23_12690 [Nostoc sp.]
MLRICKLPQDFGDRLFNLSAGKVLNLLSKVQAQRTAFKVS